MIILFASFLMGSTSGADQNSDRAAIRQTVMRLQEAWNRHDMKAFANLFAEDADFVNVAGAWWKGRAEIEQKHRASHTTIFRDSTLSVEEVDVRFLTPDIAIAHVLTALVGQKIADGTVVSPRRALLTQVLQKQSGDWMIVASHNTDVRPPTPPPTVNTTEPSN
ncbi:MAG: SgcJ/EcaC family oxidoreductase [Candidatus Sulfotelmatobacter sp.]